MAATGVKFDEGAGGLATNCFPVRTLLRTGEEAGGAWLVAQKAEQRRRFKAVLCARPRTYSQIQEERKKAQKEGTKIIPPPPVQTADDDDDGAEDSSTLDGFFLMKHCCVDDPTDLCSVNISGQGLSEVKEDDLTLFDNVAYVNASENILPLVAFRGFPIIRELELSLNGIRGITVEPAEFPYLEILDLSYNNLSQEDLLALGLLPKLRFLTLSGNGLTSLPPDLTRPEVDNSGRRINRYKELQHLMLDDNKLSDLTTFAALAGLRKLRQLNLDKNEIFSIPQLMLVEGKHVMTETASSKKRSKSVASSRRSKASSRKTPRSRKEETQPDQIEINSTNSNVEQQKEETIDSIKEEPSDVKEEQGKSADEFNFDELELEDLNLGDFEPEGAGTSRDDTDFYADDEGGPMPPPFPELRSLSLANNQIYDEECLLAVAAWPMLQELIIHNNPLTMLHSGDPPLLKRFLQNKLGVSLVRKKPTAIVKPPIEVSQKSDRKVNSHVPRVQKRNIDEILLAIEGPKEESLPSSRQKEETLVGKHTPLPPISPKNEPVEEIIVETPKSHQSKDQDGSTFFMTQVDGQEDENHSKEKESPKKVHETGKMRKKSKKPVADKYKGYEALLDAKEDPDQTLPKDIQGSVRALHYTLNHPNIYKENQVNLDRPQPPYQPYSRAKAPETIKRKTRPEKVEEALVNLKERSTVIEAPLNEILQHKSHKDFPEAPELLSEIQRRYNMVRATSMKEARNAKKLLQQTIADVTI